MPLRCYASALLCLCAALKYASALLYLCAAMPLHCYASVLLCRSYASAMLDWTSRHHALHSQNWSWGSKRHSWAWALGVGVARGRGGAPGSGPTGAVTQHMNTI